MLQMYGLSDRQNIHIFLSYILDELVIKMCNFFGQIKQAYLKQKTSSITGEQK